MIDRSTIRVITGRAPIHEYIATAFYRFSLD
jgi:hypothetical protein